MRRWEVLAELLKANGLKSFLEVGCKEGRTTAHILRTCPEVSVTAIDPWMHQPAQAGKKGGETYEKWDFEVIEQMFRRNVEDHEDRLTFRRTTSKEYAPEVPAASLGLIFIDGAHDYESVVEDIALWLPKVQPGGFLAGHDYQHKFPSVMRAVADSFNLMRVQVADDSVWWVPA